MIIHFSNLTIQFSRAVLGFIVFHGHTGISLDYDWISLHSTEEFQKDLEIAIQVWEAVKTLEKKEEDHKEFDKE